MEKRLTFSCKLTPSKILYIDEEGERVTFKGKVGSKDNLGTTYSCTKEGDIYSNFKQVSGSIEQYQAAQSVAIAQNIKRRQELALKKDTKPIDSYIRTLRQGLSSEERKALAAYFYFELTK